MDWARQCTGVIPCFNEAGCIAEVVRGIQLHLPAVIVVDDGSTDATAVNAAAAGAEVLRQPANRGKGAALHAGWQRAQARGFAWALTMDGDGQHAPDDIPAFFDCAEETGASLVIGNRMGQEGSMPWLRRQANRWMTRCLSNLAGITLADSQCGFRLLDLEAWSHLELATSRFEIESELLVAFLAAQRRVEFVSVQVIYRKQLSKIHPVVDSWRWFRWWLAQRKVARPERREKN